MGTIQSNLGLVSMVAYTYPEHSEVVDQKNTRVRKLVVSVQILLQDLGTVAHNAPPTRSRFLVG